MIGIAPEELEVYPKLARQIVDKELTLNLKKMLPSHLNSATWQKASGLISLTRPCRKN
jgi:hypothetical protein